MFAFFKKLFAKADANKDGRVDVQDAKIAVEGVKAKTNQVKTNARVAIKKAAVKAKAVRKPRAK